MGLKLKNNAVSRLAAGLSSGATSLSVLPGEGARFPSLSAGEYFPITLIRGSDGAIEIARATARSVDVFTIVRAQENTTALAFVAGDRVELRFTAGAMDEFKVDSVTSSSLEKTTPDAADLIPLVDFASSSLRKLTWAALSSCIQTFTNKVLGSGCSWNGNAVPVAHGGTGGTTQGAARTGLGLGTSATQNVGTSENNVVQRGTGGGIPVGTTWTVREVAGVLYFAASGVDKAKLDSSGNLTVTGNVTAFGTM